MPSYLFCHPVTYLYIYIYIFYSRNAKKKRQIGRQTKNGERRRTNIHACTKSPFSPQRPELLLCFYHRPISTAVVSSSSSSVVVIIVVVVLLSALATITIYVYVCVRFRDLLFLRRRSSSFLSYMWRIY